MMDLEALFGKTIFIRLSEDGDGFVSTVRYGPLYRRSDNWIVEVPHEAAQQWPPDENK